MTATDPALNPKDRDDAALKWAAEEVAAPAAAVPVPVLVPVPAGVMELVGAVFVTPKAEVVAGVAVGMAVVVLPDLAPELELLDVEAEVEEEEEEELLCAEMEKESLFAMTWLTSEICTASKIYPSPAATIGNSRVIDPV